MQEACGLRKVPARATKKFDLTCESFEDWCTAHMALPKETGRSEDEKFLAIWLAEQVSNHKQGKLPEDQLAKLRMIPVLRNFPRMLRRSELVPLRFNLTCKSFEKWFTKHGVLPLETGETDEERSLATWLQEMLLKHQNNKLTDDQLAKLKKIPVLSDFPRLLRRSELHALGFQFPRSKKAKTRTAPSLSKAGSAKKTTPTKPKPSWKRTSERSYLEARDKIAAHKFDQGYQSFKDWCSSNKGKWPSITGKGGPEEMSLALWIKNKLASYQNGKLPYKQFSRLKKIPEVSRRLKAQGQEGAAA